MLRLLPVLLSALLIGAHFLRMGAPGTTLLCLTFPALLLVQRPWAARLVQALLALAALEWVRTLVGNITQRQAADEPWLRMAVILGLVAVGTALSALAVRGRPAADASKEVSMPPEAGDPEP